MCTVPPPRCDGHKCPESRSSVLPLMACDVEKTEKQDRSVSGDAEAAFTTRTWIKTCYRVRLRVGEALKARYFGEGHGIQ